MTYPFYEPCFNRNASKWYILEHRLSIRRNFFGRKKYKKVEAIVTEFFFNPDGASSFLPMFFDSYAEVRAYIKSIGKEILELPEKATI
jgi:hypothetical protein